MSSTRRELRVEVERRRERIAVQSIGERIHGAAALLCRRVRQADRGRGAAR